MKRSISVLALPVRRGGLIRLVGLIGLVGVVGLLTAVLVTPASGSAQSLARGPNAQLTAPVAPSPSATILRVSVSNGVETPAGAAPVIIAGVAATPPAAGQPVAPAAKTVAVTRATQPAVPAAQVAVARAAAASGTSAAAARTAYVNAMYLSVVPAGERAELAGHYVLGYNLAGLSCGTGCTGIFDGQARSSFNNAFFNQSLMYQRNTIAHEAAHAYGLRSIAGYALPSWAGLSGWPAEFHALDRSFAATFDAEAWASCVAWKESGFNNRVDQITHVCTPAAAALAMAQL